MSAAAAPAAARRDGARRSLASTRAALGARAALLPVAGTVGSIALYAVACPPHEWASAAWIAPGLLLVATRGAAQATALACGLLFGALFGLLITPWTFHATLLYFGSDHVRATAFVLAMWLVYAGIPYGLLIVAYGAAARRLPAVLLAPVGAWLWVASEWLRSTMLTGLPWELLGDTQFRNLPLIQIADLGGVYAVSFVVALVSIALAESVRELLGGAGLAMLARRLAMPALALGAVLLYGASALRSYAGPVGEGGRNIAVVQARIPTAFRWKRAFFQRTIATYGALTRDAGDATLDLIVWPENAANFHLSDEPLLAAQLGVVARTAREGLLTGAPRIDAGDGLARNSAYLIAGDGRIRAVYDKQRLVPFAEYDPFRWLRAERGAAPDTYVAGREVAPLRGDSMTLGTMICYEALFPHLVRALVREGADLLVNISNDAWLDSGDGVAPAQHFSHVVFRAIESRRFLVRASDSGVSGFVAPTGRIDSVVAGGTEGAAVGRVAPMRVATFYGRWGDTWIALGAILVAIALGMGARRHAGIAA